VLHNNYPSLWIEIKATGGLKIYTTLNMKDQLAADRAVDFVAPPRGGIYNPNRNADTEVLIQPGTGAVRAIAIDRRYGKGYGEDEVNYAVNSNYGGGEGVQTGSSSKIFTLITALKQGFPFGYKIKIQSPTTVSGYQNCQHVFLNPYPVTNSEGATKGVQSWPLYSATVSSINVYFAHLEQQVGLCQTVQTAVDMGMTRADGKSLLRWDHNLGSNGEPADDVTSFTLGSVAVSPMSMAAAYASVAARGWYCAPKVLTKILTSTGGQIPVQPDPCHRDMSQGVADAANYILQGVLTVGTAAGRGIGRPAAGKTGTGNSGGYAAFAGYTPTLAGYVSVFNPIDPTNPAGEMLGQNSCFRQFIPPSPSYLDCPGQMYGDDAPAATWEYSFLDGAQLGRPIPFVGPPSSYFRQGPGDGGPTTVPKKGRKHGGGPPPPPGGGPPPPPTPTPTPTPGH
jgi:membrane peptidoglycan carboxypeptidase